MQKLCFSLAVILAMQTAAFAASAPAPKSTRFQGTVVSLASGSIAVSTKQGTRTAAIDPHVRVYDVTKSSVDKVQSGSFIGTTVVPQPDGSYKSTEVHIFANALRGMGEGFTKMNSTGTRMMANSTVRPVNMMANSTIRSVSSNAGGKTISMRFPSGKIVVHIPPDVPVSYLTPGTRTLLKNGANVLVICSGTPGHLTAKTIVVIEKGASLG